MRVRDFANAIGVEPNEAIARIQALGIEGAPGHANSSIPEVILQKLAETYPQLATADKADSPEGVEAAATVAAPVAPAAPATPATPPAQPEALAPAQPTPAPNPAPAPNPPPRPSSPLNVIPQSDAPKDNGDPIARAQVGRDAVSRQYNPVAPANPRKYRVSYPGAEAQIITAVDENEAWAKFNDANQKSWSPRLREIVAI